MVALKIYIPNRDWDGKKKHN